LWSISKIGVGNGAAGARKRRDRTFFLPACPNFS
jgi:hypothetical protein